MFARKAKTFFSFSHPGRDVSLVKASRCWPWPNKLASPPRETTLYPSETKQEVCFAQNLLSLLLCVDVNTYVFFFFTYVCTPAATLTQFLVERGDLVDGVPGVGARRDAKPEAEIVALDQLHSEKSATTSGEKGTRAFGCNQG